MLQLLKDALSIIYPIVCSCCDELLLEDEKAICNQCLQNLPYTNHNFKHNLIANRLMAIAPISGVYALTYFNTGNKVEQLIHQLKYKKNANVGLRLGELLGEKTSNLNLDYTCIVPVPLHKRKQAKRGYNQAELIAKGLHNYTKIPLNTNSLIRNKYTTSQTKKSRVERYKAMKKVFSVSNPTEIKNHKIILIDDVITTGATSLSCVEVLLEAGAKDILLMTIGYANPF